MRKEREQFNGHPSLTEYFSNGTKQPLDVPGIIENHVDKLQLPYDPHTFRVTSKTTALKIPHIFAVLHDANYMVDRFGVVPDALRQYSTNAIDITYSELTRGSKSDNPHTSTHQFNERTLIVGSPTTNVVFAYPISWGKARLTNNDIDGVKERFINHGFALIDSTPFELYPISNRLNVHSIALVFDPKHI